MIVEYKRFVEKKQHNLVGVVLICENKILLVKPMKFIKKLAKWSIPKGHLEVDMIADALKELKEETGVVLSPNQLEKAGQDRVVYMKNGFIKNLNIFTLKIKREDLNVRLVNDMILHPFVGEIYQAGFFAKEQASELIEDGQKEFLKYLN
jgi:predicted NUDIX family NTP pyrophosphohydrolase